MFWGGIGEAYTNLRSPLFAHDGNVNAETYLDCLKKTLLKNMPHTLARTEWQFMQDSCSRGAHSSKTIKAWLDSMGIKYLGDCWPMIWPPNSPDLNPIEAMWNILKNRVADRHPQNKADLIKFAKEEWDLIPNDVVQKLLDRATQLRKECAKNGGYKVGR